VPLIIRPAQMQAFRAREILRFESEMIEHSRLFNPRLCEVLGEEQLGVAVREQIQAAARHGFSNRGPIRLCVELMFLFGSHFAEDPQYPQLAEILRSEHQEMSRAQDLHEWANDYLDIVHGRDNINVYRALGLLQKLAGEPFEPVSDAGGAIVAELTRVFPEKCEYLGAEAVGRLTEAGLREARDLGFFAPRQQVLIVALMFAFGAGCTRDPLYPWISRLLQDRRIVDAPMRARRLERRAVTWLDHVLAAAPERRP
jgi:hypothetical protein